MKHHHQAKAKITRRAGIYDSEFAIEN